MLHMRKKADGRQQYQPCPQKNKTGMETQYPKDQSDG